MTDRPTSLSTQNPVPSQAATTIVAVAPISDDAGDQVETVDEEPYTIKCICNFADDDGNTIFCETCETWQHIECFYPYSREEVSREDFAHSCAECKPRNLERQKAIDRMSRIKNPNPTPLETPLEKKPKRPPTKGHKKKPKPNDAQPNGQNGSTDHGKHNHNSSDQGPPPKKAKSLHRPTQSLSSQAPKRSPSYGNSRSNPTHPPSPATTPPDLPDDFQIHHYSEGFYSLYNEHNVPETQSNAFASLAIPTALARWRHEPNIMKQEVGRTHDEVFRDARAIEPKQPKLEVEDATRALSTDTTLRWRFLKSTSAIEKDAPLTQLNGEIGFQKDYCSDPDNLWSDLSSPLPFVFFHPLLPLYIDTRKEGSVARYVRRSCKPNAQLDTFLSDDSDYQFWLVSDRHIAPNEQITLPWDFRLEKSVSSRWLYLLGLSEDESSGHDEPEIEDAEYTAIANWIDRILSEYGGCACDLENDCAFARFHRHYLHVRNQNRPTMPKKKHRKSRTQAMSPSSTGQATNSRAPSEGQVDNGVDHDGRSQTGSSRSKPPSRDPTPLRQGSLDQPGILTEPTDRDKRKVAMVEDSFRRMEQQQPPRKKKRVSDGTNASASSKTKRAGSTSHGQYVDAGTCRSTSGSPVTVQSPHFQTTSQHSVSGRQSSVNRSRQASASPRPMYCDVGVQTDPVQGEWFSGSATSPRPKKKIIPLSRRLLSGKHRIQNDEEQRKKQPLTPRTSSGSVMDVMEAESPSTVTKPIVGVKHEIVSPSLSHSEELPIADASTGSQPATLTPGVPSKTKTPELRVQMPPVPAFDNSNNSAVVGGNSTTPLSATSSVIQSPLSTTSLPTPFGPPMTNGVAVQASPAKKKLSLSDYTKRSKAAGKVAGGNAILKPTLPSPEESKMELTLDHPMVKVDEESRTPVKETANGVF